MATITQKIVPHLWFDKEAKEAAEFYTTIFEDSRIIESSKLDDTPSGSVETVSFELFGQAFQAISAGPHFTFNESISFIVNCDTQEEVDRYWHALTAGGGEESMCGWLKDKYGLSWQIVPTILGDMLNSGGAKQVERATKALLEMKKLDIAALQKAYNGN